MMYNTIFDRGRLLPIIMYHVMCHTHCSCVFLYFLCQVLTRMSRTTATHLMRSKICHDETDSFTAGAKLVIN